MATTNQNPDNNIKHRTAAICHALNQFRKERTFCDIELQVEDKIYPCHKNVISVSSKHFYTMFNSSFIEKEAPLVELLGDIDPDVFEEVMEFLYTSEITFTEQNAYGLLRTSHYLQIQELETRCSDYILGNPNVENVFEICEYFAKIGQTDYLDKAIKNMLPKIKMSQGFANFFSISHTVLASILEHARQSKSLEYTTKELVNTIFDWTAFNWADRKCYVRHLLKSVLPSDDFTVPFLEKFSDHLSIQNTTISRPLLEIFCTYKSEFYVDKMIYKKESWIWKKRNYCRVNHTIKVTRHENFDCFLSASEAPYNYFWRDVDNKVLCTPPVRTSDYELVTIGDLMYLYNSNEYYVPDEKSRWLFGILDRDGNPMLRYHFDLDLWYSCQIVPNQLYHSYLTSLDKMVYLIGGTTEYQFNKGENKNIIQCYDKRSPGWITKQIQEKFILNGAVCVHKDEIWIYEKNILTNEGCFRIYNSTAGKFRSSGTNDYHFKTPGFLISCEDELWYVEKRLKGEMFRISQNKWEKCGTTPSKIAAPEGCRKIHEIPIAHF